MSRSQLSGRYDHLDGLRGIAALIVVLHHCIDMFDLAITTGNPDHAYGRLDTLISGLPFLILDAGNFSVCIFFALSGFVLTMAFSRSRLGAIGLATKRYVRLALPILATCIGSYVLLLCGAYRNASVATFTRSDWAATQFLQPPHLLSAVTEGLFRDLIFQAPGSQSYNSTLWTMQIEFAGSLFLIAIIACLKRLNPEPDRLRARGLIVFTSAAVLLFYTYLMPFCIGAAFHLARGGASMPASMARRSAARGMVYAALGAVALFLGTIPYSSQPSFAVELFAHVPVVLSSAYPLSLIDAQAFWHVIGAAGVLFIVQTTGFWRRALSHRACRFLGDISFPLYLVHVPILCSAGAATYLAVHTSGNALVAILAAAVTTLMLSLSVSALATRAIEGPAIALSDRAGRTADAVVRRIRHASRSP